MTNKSVRRNRSSSAPPPPAALASVKAAAKNRKSIPTIPSGLVSSGAPEIIDPSTATLAGIPMIDPLTQEIPENFKTIIKDLMEISSGMVSENKTTKMAAVQAMKKKFAELGLFSWFEMNMNDGGKSLSASDLSQSSITLTALGQAMAALRTSATSNSPNIQLAASLMQAGEQILRGVSTLEDEDWLADDDLQQDIDDFTTYTQMNNDHVEDLVKSENIIPCACGDAGCREYVIDAQGDSDLDYLFDIDNDLNTIDPMKLQIVQTAEHELASVYSMFESKQFSEEEKMGLLKRKYMELMQQDIRHRLESLRAKETVSAVEIERDAVKKELERMNTLKSKLDSLCKELVEENRRIKSEATKRSESAKCKLKGGCSRCGCTLDTSTAFPNLPDLPEINVLQKVGTRSLAEQLHKFVDIYRLRERHFKAILRVKDSEMSVQVGKALHLEITNDTFKQRIEGYEKQIGVLGKAESELKAQLAVYVDKFKQVEETLGKSNDLFATFRREMEQMTLKLTRLENENHQLQNKCNTLSRNIIEMADERTKQNASMETLRNQKGKLEQLCRTLQSEYRSTMNPSTASNSESENPK